MVFFPTLITAAAPAFSTFQIASLAFSGLSFLSQSYGAYQQAQAQQEQAAYQAAVARNNAITAGRTATAIAERGKILEDEHRRKIKQTKGSAKTVQAAKGFLVDDTEDSTNVGLLADIAEIGELDILKIRDNVELERRQALIQGSNYQTQAGLFDAKAGSISPLMSGTSTLLAGAADTLKTAKTVGLFS
tara:strand:+ start:6374 stop:6940 length:567 start_codon:yes stop_codon:yes gene_type:complete